MKTYKMSSDEIKKVNKGKIKSFIILFLLLLIPITFFSYYNGFSLKSLIVISALIVQAIYSLRDTGIHHFELNIDSNTLSFFKRGKLKKSFDLKQVRALSTVGENESTLVITVDNNIKGDYHSQLLGITKFNELINDVSAINDGTYQS